MRKYLLSTGESTTKVEEYILDLFKLYLQIWPGDIPGAKEIGFDFILTDTKKDELVSEVKNRIGRLVKRIQDKFDSNITITVESIDIIDEEKALVTINVNNTRGEDIEIDLYEK